MAAEEVTEVMEWKNKKKQMRKTMIKEKCNEKRIEAGFNKGFA